jgi:hypothetical protein
MRLVHQKLWKVLPIQLSSWLESAWYHNTHDNRQLEPLIIIRVP